MKQLFIFFMFIILTSCSDKKQKKIEVDTVKDIFALSIDEVIEYNCYYEKDTLLIKVEVLHYREKVLEKKETRYFEYDENNQLISEKHFLHKGDSAKLIFNKKVSNNISKTIEFYPDSNDTLSFDQYQYDNKGNLINHKTKYNRGPAQRDSEYFDYKYDTTNKLIQAKKRDNITNEIRAEQYKYEVSGDTLIAYDMVDGKLSSVEKTISKKNPEIVEVFTYNLPDYILDTYEKKIITDKDNYLEIMNFVGLSIDSTFVQDGKKIKFIEHYPEKIYYMRIYEYDNFGNLTKETRYSKLLRESIFD